MKTGKLIFALVFLMLFADASMAAKWKAKHVVFKRPRLHQNKSGREH